MVHLHGALATTSIPSLGQSLHAYPHDNDSGRKDAEENVQLPKRIDGSNEPALICDWGRHSNEVGVVGTTTKAKKLNLDI